MDLGTSTLRRKDQCNFMWSFITSIGINLQYSDVHTIKICRIYDLNLKYKGQFMQRVMSQENTNAASATKPIQMQYILV